MRLVPEVLFVLAIASTGGLAAGAEPAAHLVDPSRLAATRGLLDEIIQRADRESLDEDPRWLALLHYERLWLSPGFRSRASSASFFLSDTGDRDPRAELQATLRAFLDPDAIVRDDEHAQCAFIARRHWLSRKLGPALAGSLDLACPHYERWREGLDAAGLTLIFPEGFMSNPASIFGHTLLRIDAERSNDRGDVLGYAVDFTANTGDDGALKYIVKGIGGAYPAVFGVNPYYEQLERYSDWENRDIWEYPLDVDSSELDFLLMHLWELRGIEFPYYFFTRNCSYELLRLLDIGVDDLDSTSGVHGPVIPIETVRAMLEDPGLRAEPRYRPAPETQLRAARRSLSREDRRLVQSITSGRTDPQGTSVQALPPPRRARILEIAYDQLRYEYLAGQVTEEESRGLSRRLLIARSQVRSVEPDEPVPDEPGEARGVDAPQTRPDQSHEPSLLAVRAGWRDDEAFIDLRLRPAFHDLMDAGGGMLPHTQIRILDTVMRIYPESAQVRLQELTLLEIVSLSPRSRVFRPLAWSGGTGLRTRRVPGNDELEDSSVWSTHGSAGAAWDPHPGVLLYGLGGLRLDAGPDLDDKVSFGPGAQLGVFVGEAGSRFKLHAFGVATWFVLGDTTTTIRGGLQGRLTTSRNTSVHLEGTVNRAYGESWGEGLIQVNLHF